MTEEKSKTIYPMRKLSLFLGIFLLILTISINLVSSESLSGIYRYPLNFGDSPSSNTSLQGSVPAMNNEFSTSNQIYNSGYIQQINEQKTWSENYLCEFVKGCLDKNICYPFGYVKNETYCWDKSPKYISSRIYISEFVNQLNEGESCTYNFQCLSNFCSGKLCQSENINALIIQLQDKINKLEIEVDNLKNNSEQNEVELINNTPSISGNAVLNNNDSNFLNKKISFWNKIFKHKHE